jgi:putative endonuclease
MWFVYILKCSDNSFYTGITTDVNRRLLEHNTSSKAAKYTRIRRPVQIIYTKEFGTRSDASIEECRIKRLTRQQKEKLVEKQ